MPFQKVILVILLLFGEGCVSRSSKPIPTPLPNVSSVDLLLDLRAFPQQWEVNPCTKSPRCFGETDAYRAFIIAGVPGHVSQEITRFDSVEAAHAEFQAIRDKAFKRSTIPSQQPSTDFLPPPEITYRSVIANEYYLGCGIDIVPACDAIFRYRNYFVEFFFNVDAGYVDGAEIKGNGLKIKEIEPILRAMDEKASSVLGIPLPKTP